jgi:hypothetical protein
MAFAGVLGLGGLLGTGTNEAKAQVFLSTPGFSLGVGTPVVGAYPYAPVVPAPVVGAYPVYPAVRPYPYVYARPPLYGPRYYGGGYYGGYYGHHRGYRHW